MVVLMISNEVFIASGFFGINFLINIGLWSSRKELRVGRTGLAGHSMANGSLWRGVRGLDVPAVTGVEGG